MESVEDPDEEKEDEVEVPSALDPSREFRLINSPESEEGLYSHKRNDTAISIGEIDYHEMYSTSGSEGAGKIEFPQINILTSDFPTPLQTPTIDVQKLRFEPTPAFELLTPQSVERRSRDNFIEVTILERPIGLEIGVQTLNIKDQLLKKGVRDGQQLVEINRKLVSKMGYKGLIYFLQKLECPFTLGFADSRKRYGECFRRNQFVCKSGLLKKSSPALMKGFQRRSFCMVEDKLDYYKKNDYTDYKGSIEFVHIEMVEVEGRVMKIKMNKEYKKRGSRVYKLKAKTKDEILDWQEAIRLNMNRYRHLSNSHHESFNRSFDEAPAELSCTPYHDDHGEFGTPRPEYSICSKSAESFMRLRMDTSSITLFVDDFSNQSISALLNVLSLPINYLENFEVNGINKIEDLEMLENIENLEQDFNVKNPYHRKKIWRGIERAKKEICHRRKIGEENVLLESPV